MNIKLNYDKVKDLLCCVDDVTCALSVKLDC